MDREMIGRVMFQPSAYFLAAGAGDASSELVAFHVALNNAGLGNVNLVKVSSIVGPDCLRVDPVRFAPGGLVAAAFASSTSRERGQLMASAIAIAFPEAEQEPALIMENSGAGTARLIEQAAIQMAREGLERTGVKVSRTESITIEHVVKSVGVTVAVVVQL